MSKDININESAILETLNAKIDYDGGNYPSSGLETYINKASYAKYLNKNQITNCLLEVPQKIKLELNNGRLTLKAGSNVIVPNRAGVFEEKVTTKDLVHSTGATQGTIKRLIYIDSSLSALGTINTTNVSSGSEMPANTWRIWYDTTNNIVNKIEATAGQVAYTCGFPLGEVTVVDGVITSINQVFNGMGYLGSTIWVDKGVKGLSAEGQNNNGTWKTNEIATSKVITRTLSGTETGQLTFRSGDIGKAGYYFVGNDGHLYNDQNVLQNNRVTFADFTITNGQITSLQPKLPFRAVDYNDIAGLKAYITETYVNGTSWYRVWSDGWIEQGGEVSVNATSTVTFIKTFTAVPTVKIALVSSRASASYDRETFPNTVTNTNFTITNTGGGGGGSCRWTACGY